MIQKVLHVTKFLFLFIFFLSCKNKIPYTNDYMILNMILEKQQLNKPSDTLFLKESNNNEYLIDYIKRLKNNSQKNEKLTNPIRNIDTIISDKTEYDNFISQKTDLTFWDLNKINSKNTYLYKSKNGRLIRSRLFVSKPIYSKDLKNAFVHVSGEYSRIIIFKKINFEWKESNIVNVLIH